RFGGAVLRREPGDEVTVRPGPIEARLSACGAGLVEREHLLDEERDGPAVEQDVVARPDEAVHVVREPEERDAQERGAGEVEPARAVCSGVALDDALLRGRIEAAEVLLVDGEGRLLADDLDGAFEAFPGEAGAEDAVPIDSLLPRADEERRVEPP